MKKNVRAMVFAALMAALLCIAAPISLPIGIVPISLATFVVYLTGVLLDWKSATVSTLLYVLLGLVGLPVFAGYVGGVDKLFGATGGYIFGYIVCAFVISFAMDRFAKNAKAEWVVAVVGMIIGTFMIYLIGTAWFLVQLPSYTISSAMSVCVIPFLPGDAAKIAAAVALGIPLRRILKKQQLL